MVLVETVAIVVLVVMVTLGPSRPLQKRDIGGKSGISSISGNRYIIGNGGNCYISGNSGNSTFSHTGNSCFTGNSGKCPPKAQKIKEKILDLYSAPII